MCSPPRFHNYGGCPGKTPDSFGSFSRPFKKLLLFLVTFRTNVQVGPKSDNIADMFLLGFHPFAWADAEVHVPVFAILLLSQDVDIRKISGAHLSIPPLEAFYKRKSAMFPVIIRKKGVKKVLA